MLTMFSMTFLIMPFSNIPDGMGQRLILGITGTLFWVTFILGYLFLFLAKSMVRRINRNSGRRNGIRKEVLIYNENNGSSGIISIIKSMALKGFRKLKFYANVPTAAADTGFIAALIVMVILNYTGNTAGYAAYVDISILVFSFNAHLLFSGDLHKFAMQADKDTV